MNTPVLNRFLSYGRIPVDQRHKRLGLRKISSPCWTRLTEIPNWSNVDLQNLCVRTDHVRLVDGEICFTTNTERSALAEYYMKKGRTVMIPSFIVRDNNNGTIYLPHDIFVSN